MEFKMKVEGSEILVQADVNSEGEVEYTTAFCDTDVYHLLDPRWQAKIDEAVYKAVEEAQGRADCMDFDDDVEAA